MTTLREKAEAYGKAKVYPSGTGRLRPIDEQTLIGMRELAAGDYTAGYRECASEAITDEQVEAAVERHNNPGSIVRDGNGPPLTMKEVRYEQMRRALEAAQAAKLRGLE